MTSVNRPESLINFLIFITIATSLGLNRRKGGIRHVAFRL